MMLTMDPRLLLGDRYGLLYYAFLVDTYLRGARDLFAQRYSRVIAHFPGEQHEHNPASFAALIESIKANGYNNYFPVKANPRNFFLTNGVHRCAVAIALGIERISYSQVFSTDGATRKFFLDIISKEEAAEVDAYYEKLLSGFSPDLAKTIRVRRLIRSYDSDLRNAPFASKTLFPTVRTYQGIGHLSGKRNTEERWGEYRLDQFIKGARTALEVGCNVGFFSSLLGKHVDHVDAFDVDPIYIDVAMAYNAGNNASFFCRRFEHIGVDQKYDVVICCAVHGWVKMLFGDFIRKVFALLNENGVLLMESHEILCEHDWPRKAAFLAEASQVLHRGYIDDVDPSIYESEIREYMVLKPSVRGEELDALIRKHGLPVSQT